MNAGANPPDAGRTGQAGENLALCYQEVLTAIVRLRASSQHISDALAFRTQIKTALKQGEQDSFQRGYPQEDVRVCTFAVVAFLDESILNSRNPVFVDWPRKPLQEELFGVHVAGDLFFRNVEKLFSRPDSKELADVLEVHQLCLLLGFQGRYRLSGASELMAVAEQMKERIRRVRGFSAELSPGWQPAAELPRVAADPWLGRLVYAAGGTCLLALLTFLVFKLLLSSAVSSVESTAGLFRL